MATMAQLVMDAVASLANNCLSCFPSASPTLRVNSRRFRIVRLIGEGGFSYVYLVEDTASHQLLALKKMQCPFGAESVQQAMREVEAYRLFAHVPNIISAVDHAVVSERGGGDEAAKTVLLLLPYYRRGNLQDMINANLVNRCHFPLRQLMTLVLGVCKALAGMHNYRPAPAQRMRIDDDAGAGAGADVDGDADGDVDDSSSSNRLDQQQPLMPPTPALYLDTSLRSFAHRDIKPANIMIDDSGSTPILMDLGSVAPSPIPVTSPSLALQIQDAAAEHCTMPYRAPELFDVRTGSQIDTKVDIWSLGCTLFACLVGKSPFEMRSDETGGTLSLCVLGGDWHFPDEPPGPQPHVAAPDASTATPAASTTPAPPRHATNTIGQAKARANDPTAAPRHDAIHTPSLSISPAVRDIVRCCLHLEPAMRPDIHQLMTMVENALEQLPDTEA